MKLLIISGLPTSKRAITYRVYHGIKYLKEKFNHDITLVSMSYPFATDKDIEYLNKYCKEVRIVNTQNSLVRRILTHFLDYLIRLITFKTKNFFDFTSSRSLENEIKNLIKINQYDLVYVGNPSLISQSVDVKLPKIIELWDETAKNKEYYELEKNIYFKIIFLSMYLFIKNYEKYYCNFDMVITPTEKELKSLKFIQPCINVKMVPFGVEICETLCREEFPSLIYTGTMNDVLNQKTILNFYLKTYPIIKEAFSNVKLYIVGKDPNEDIMKLARNDKSVNVTGFVEDMNEYLSKASVVVLPVHGHGVKTRVLEAMAIGKPIVTNSEGVYGINVTPGKDIIVEDDSKEFALRVIELLKDKEYRTDIGSKARNLIINNYSWEKTTELLNDVFMDTLNK